MLSLKLKKTTKWCTKGQRYLKFSGFRGLVWSVTFIAVDIRQTYMNQRFLHIQMHNSHGNIFIWLHCFDNDTGSPFPPLALTSGHSRNKWRTALLYSLVLNAT